MYSLDISANVPLYGQDLSYLCGPASAEMVRNGYPKPTDRVYYTQPTLWNIIQMYNSTLPADAGVGWATDPHGLQGCLQSLSSPPVNWVEFDNPSSDRVLFSVLFWMNQVQFPSPVLVYQGDHWVVVVGWETDVEPVDGSSPVLAQIHFWDPEPNDVGTRTTMTGAQWYAGPWNGAVRYPGTWYNQFVAIVEPPIPTGEASVNTVDRLGERRMTPEEALAAARRWIVERRLGTKPQYAILNHPDAEAHTPLLIRDEPREKTSERTPYYYIVPFGLRSEREPSGSLLVRVCVLVNAFTGAFEEVTSFGRPIHYLTREEALTLVASALRVEPKGFREADAELMFQAGEITHIRTYPFWRITLKNRVVYIDQLGTIHTNLLLSVPGD
jgi:hypothetical protein